MGVDLTAFGQHNLNDPTGFDLDNFVSSHTVSLAVKWACSWHQNAHNWTTFPFWEKDAEEHTASEIFKINKTIRISLPGGFSLVFGAHLFQLYHVTRWYDFLAEAEHRLILRRVMKFLSGIVGSDTVIYLPDSAFNVSAASDALWNGEDFTQLTESLNKNYGPPKFDPNVLYEDDLDNEILENGYFIDRFTGLETN